MIIEAICEKNIDDLSNMMLALWPHSTYDSELENCLRILKSENETVYLAKVNGDLIAFVYLSLRNEYTEGARDYPVAYIEGIYVTDRFRRKGIGLQLLNKAKEWALNKGCTQMASDAEIGNSMSISFHKQVGFKEVNRIVNFIQEL